MTSTDLAQKLKAAFNEILTDPVEFRGELSLRLGDPKRIVEVCRFAKQHLGFDYLVDITSIDNYGESPRFTVVYHLYGYAHRHYLRLITDIEEEISELPSVTSVWRTADWHEREIFDMMGIRFSGHPDLRRILMWEGYPYHPLRKDFPLAGKPSELPEVAFSDTAPLAGGPFVTVAGGKDAMSREPRVRLPESNSLEINAPVERTKNIGDAPGHSQAPGPANSKPT